MDDAGTAVSFPLAAMPQSAIARLLIQFLSISFHVFPAEAPQSSSARGVLEHPAGLVLPVASLTLVTYAELQPVHALLGHRHPGPGLHPHRSRQGVI